MLSQPLTEKMRAAVAPDLESSTRSAFTSSLTDVLYTRGSKDGVGEELLIEDPRVWMYKANRRIVVEMFGTLEDYFS